MSGKDLKNLNIKLEDTGATAQLQAATQTCNICKATINTDTDEHSRKGAVYTCGACTSKHSTAPSSTPQTVTTDAAKPVYKLCDVHKNSQVKVYCIPCRKPLCTECLVPLHLKHDFTTIEEEVDKVTAQLEARKKELEQHIQKEQTHKDRFEKRLNEFQKVERTVKSELDAKLNAEKRKLEKEYEAVAAKNKEVAGQFLSTMKQQVDESNRRLTDLQGRVNQVQQLIEDMETMNRSDCLAVTVPTVSPATATAGQLASPPQSPKLTQRIDRSLSRKSVHAGTQTCADDLNTPEASAQITADDLKTPVASPQISHPSSTEGKLRYQLYNVGQVRQGQVYYSEEVRIADIPWCLQVIRSGGFGDQLLVVLHCDRHSTLSRSEFSVDVEFSVSVVHADTRKTLTEKHDHTFSTNDWWKGAYLCYWKDLGDRGFITNDSITLEADMKVKSVRGVPA